MCICSFVSDSLKPHGAGQMTVMLWSCTPGSCASWWGCCLACTTKTTLRYLLMNTQVCLFHMTDLLGSSGQRLPFPFFAFAPSPCRGVSVVLRPLIECYPPFHGPSKQIVPLMKWPYKNNSQAKLEWNYLPSWGKSGISDAHSTGRWWDQESFSPIHWFATGILAIALARCCAGCAGLMGWAPSPVQGACICAGDWEMVVRQTK